MNDDFLHTFHKAPRREFAANLYQKISKQKISKQRISKPMNTTSRIRSFRFATLAFSLVVLIAAAMIFSPATRALADTIIHQFGAMIFVQAAPEPKAPDAAAGQQAVDNAEKKDPAQDQAQAEQSKAQGPSNDASAAYAQDVAAASELSGFTVLAPAYLPDGYVSTRDSAAGEWTILYGNGDVRASISYQDPTGERFLTIEQISNQERESKTVESPKIVDVTVRGQAGVWLPNGPRKNILVWDENGITYMMISDHLTLDEVLKVAESLGR